MDSNVETSGTKDIIEPYESFDSPLNMPQRERGEEPVKMDNDVETSGTKDIELFQLNMPGREREHPKMDSDVETSGTEDIEDNELEREHGEGLAPPMKFGFAPPMEFFRLSELFEFRTTSCIYKVDKRIRDQKPNAYTPDTISIGPYHAQQNQQRLFIDPYHNKDPQMQVMAALKSNYKEALFVRTGSCRKGYEEAIEAIKPSPLEYYFVPLNLANKREFLDVMLIDGLFIIELFRKCANVKVVRDAKEKSGVEVDANEESGGVKVDAEDPIFYSNLMRARVIGDVALLENQIPMSVLQTLFEKSKKGGSKELSLVELALDFFDPLIPGAKDKYTSVIQSVGSNIEHKHLLDLLSFTLEAPLPPYKTRSTTTPQIIPCVTELQHSGVRFKSRRDAHSLLDLKFNSNGVFEIPPLCVNDYTDSFFRNLIAYEQHRYEGKYCMTSYAHLMDCLINSAADVAILRDSDIILNYLGDDKKVASLFNNLCSEILIGDFIYDELYVEVRDHYKFFWNKWRATLRRDFCNSPWTIIPVVAAAILLFLSLWSALFSAFPVFNVSFKH